MRDEAERRGVRVEAAPQRRCDAKKQRLRIEDIDIGMVIEVSATILIRRRVRESIRAGSVPGAAGIEHHLGLVGATQAASVGQPLRSAARSETRRAVPRGQAATHIPHACTVR